MLPSLVLIGIGFGLTSRLVRDRHMRRAARDAGVASAMVNTSQQIGGSIGTALLSTLAAAAATPVDGYTTAFAWAAAILAGGAVICATLLRSSTRPEAAHGPTEAAAV